MATKFAKATAAAMVLGFACSAQANEIYVDNGADYDGKTGFVDAETTTQFNDLTFNYTSSSEIIDTANDNVIGAGDTIISSLSGAITGFGTDPNFLPAPASFTDNDMPSSWRITFDFNDLTGTLLGGGAVVFTSGTIDVFYNDASNAAVKMFELDVISGFIGAGNQQFNGNVINYQDNALAGLSILSTDQVMNIISGGTGSTFKDAATAAGEPVQFQLDQNVSDGDDLALLLGTLFTDQAGYNAGTDSFDITAEHNLDATFTIPEPAPIALMGLGLLGFGLSRRNKKA